MQNAVLDSVNHVLVESIIGANLRQLVHSDICGKVTEKTIGGAEYFLMIKHVILGCTY